MGSLRLQVMRYLEVIVRIVTFVTRSDIAYACLLVPLIIQNLVDKNTLIERALQPYGKHLRNPRDSSLWFFAIPDLSMTFL
jgi:hypothetical protein